MISILRKHMINQTLNKIILAGFKDIGVFSSDFVVYKKDVYRLLYDVGYDKIIMGYKL